VALKIGKAKLKKDKKNAEPNPSYQRDLIECFKQGYAHLSDSKDEKERYKVRQTCRGLDEKGRKISKKNKKK
jgi:hypothetical protein